MNNSSASSFYDVVIVGAGPVGLFLANALQQTGLRFLAIEHRAKSMFQTRSIGLHPTSLERLQQLGLASELIARGVQVRQGSAWRRGACLGRVDFSALPGSFPFVLSVPQHDTEAVLEGHLAKVGPGRLKRGWEVLAIEDREGFFRVQAANRARERLEVTAHVVVGCDGRNGMIRRLMGVGFPGADYPDGFVMGDARDDTGFGDEARIYLDERGFVESFPLPGGRRRWVVQTTLRDARADELVFLNWVRQRAGVDLTDGLVDVLSTYGVQHHLADQFVRGRMALAGDAAHVMSPVGGQGMNAGWLDAWDLSVALNRALRRGGALDELLADYGERARRRALLLSGRAERYMAIGRGGRWTGVKSGLIALGLRTGLRRTMARRFAMMDL